MNNDTICKNCGGSYGLHNADTNQCPVNGVEAPAGKPQYWSDSTFITAKSTQTNETTPLWKELNEKRTQGEWIIRHNIGYRITPKDSGKYIAAINHTTGWVQESQANAQYTALAVNNLHHLAEALETLINVNLNNINVLSRSEKEALIRAKEALNRIS